MPRLRLLLLRIPSLAISRPVALVLCPCVLLQCFLLLSVRASLSQDTISVDAVSVLPVCSEKHPVAAGPCATAPKPLNKMNPSYPEKARRKRKEGTVTLGLTVNKDGSVSDVHVVTSVDEDIDRAALDAVSQWKFDPGTYQGKPVDVELNVSVNFHLSTTAQQTPPNNNSQQQKDATNDLRNMYSDAAEAFNRGDYATTINLLHKFTSINPGYPSAWNLLGRALLSMNQLDAAAQAIQTAIQKDPADRNAYHYLGVVYWRQRKYEDAAAQFRKQIVINPDDHYAHRSLGLMLAGQHRCGEAMPELQRALSLTPNHPAILLAQGGCDLDLGNQSKGISELEQATSISSAPGPFNSAAYALGNRNIELGMAEKWSDTCLTIASSRLHNISLDQLTPEKLSYAYEISHYWDTRGWIYFRGGDTNKALPYIEGSWWLVANPTVGDHLGQIYEKVGRPKDAAKTYAMAIASADLPNHENVNQDDLADARKRLAQLADGDDERMLKQAHVDLSTRSVLYIANEGRLNASADYGVRLSVGEKPSEFRQLNGDKSLAKFADSLRVAKLAVVFPSSSDVELPLRGTLTCRPEDAQCRFAFLSPEEAINIARNEMAASSSTSATTASRDPHIYDNTAMGMRVWLPDDWKLVEEEPGSFSHPRNAMFTKTGTAAFFLLTRERFEGSFDLYLKMLESGLSTRPEFKRYGEKTVKRDGLTGTRWTVNWEQNGVVYTGVMEMFSGGAEDYYRITTLAPKEVYDRYAETFEDVLRSVQFPMLHVDSQLLDPAK